MKRYYIFITILVLVSVAVVAAQIGTGKAPAKDQKIVRDLDDIKLAVDKYATKQNRLPAKLTDLDLTGDLKTRAADYEYHSTSRSKYELCAVFETDASTKYTSTYSDPSPSEHKKGHQCFTEESYVSELDAPANVTYSPPPPGSQNATVSICGKVSAVGSAIVNQTVTSLDIGKGTLTTKSADSLTTLTFTLPSGGATIYDAKCSVVTLTTIKAGDKITVYTGTAANIAAVIQKSN